MSTTINEELKAEINLILSIMESKNYGYTNDGKGGCKIRAHYLDKTFDVSVEAYERAYVINEAKRAMIDWPMDKVSKVKDSMYY